MRYAVWLEQHGDSFTVEFPDAPGCKASGSSRENALANAEEILLAWLDQFEDDSGPPEPRSPRTPPRKELAWIDLPMSVGLPLQCKWARLRAGLSKAELAAQVGLVEEQIATIERYASGLSVDTLEKHAQALGMRLTVTFEDMTQRARS